MACSDVNLLKLYTHGQVNITSEISLLMLKEKPQVPEGVEGSQVKQSIDKTHELILKEMYEPAVGADTLERTNSA